MFLYVEKKTFVNYLGKLPLPLKFRFYEKQKDYSRRQWQHCGV